MKVLVAVGVMGDAVWLRNTHGSMPAPAIIGVGHLADKARARIARLLPGPRGQRQVLFLRREGSHR
jgi:hypothetical protein